VQMLEARPATVVVIISPPSAQFSVIAPIGCDNAASLKKHNLRYMFQLIIYPNERTAGAASHVLKRLKSKYLQVILNKLKILT